MKEDVIHAKIVDGVNAIDKGEIMDMIITSECEQCTHSTLDESDKSKLKIYCQIKDKTYYWGQCIPCDYKEPRKNV